MTDAAEAGPFDGMLKPAIDDDSRPFWEACDRGELRIQRCAACGVRRMPPRPLCPHCRSFETAWDVMSGRATVWSVVVAHPPLLPAYGDQAPYNVVVVALDDDPSIRLVGNVVAAGDAPLDSIDPHTVEIGDAVTVAFRHLADGVALPVWVPA